MIGRIKDLYKKHGKKFIFAWIGMVAVKWVIVIAFGTYIIDLFKS